MNETLPNVASLKPGAKGTPSWHMDQTKNTAQEWLTNDLSIEKPFDLVKSFQEAKRFMGTERVGLAIPYLEKIIDYLEEGDQRAKDISERIAFRIDFGIIKKSKIFDHKHHQLDLNVMKDQKFNTSVFDRFDSLERKISWEGKIKWEQTSELRAGYFPEDWFEFDPEPK